MSQSVEALENQYFLLRGSLSTLTERGGATTNQLDQLRTQIAQSRTNFLTSVNNNLHDDNPQIAALVTQLNTEETSIRTAIDHLGEGRQGDRCDHEGCRRRFADCREGCRTLGQRTKSVCGSRRC